MLAYANLYPGLAFSPHYKRYINSIAKSRHWRFEYAWQSITLDFHKKKSNIYMIICIYNIPSINSTAYVEPLISPATLLWGNAWSWIEIWWKRRENKWKTAKKVSKYICYLSRTLAIEDKIILRFNPVNMDYPKRYREDS